MNKLIVAPLNWGLGHATRCIPIIESLIKNNFIPVIASDGNALRLLQKEFPTLEYIELPSYNISYSKNLKWDLIIQVPKILKAVRKEKQLIARYVQKNKVVGIISDNRFGVRNEEVPSVYLTHQINVHSGIFTFATSRIHQRIIEKFDECWIPDRLEEPTFSGKLSQLPKRGIKTKRIGILSRFKKEDLPIKNDILFILSGPEPHRSTLELKILEEIKGYSGSVALVQGLINETQTSSHKGQLTVFNYLLTHQLQDEINSSKLIVCRSGYSSIMDLAKLHKDAFFIPTTNQTEQEYLAKHLSTQKLAPFVIEEEFKIQMLQKVKGFKGLKNASNDFEASLFNLFERKRKR